MASIKCAACKGYHPTVAVVRICNELHNESRPVRPAMHVEPFPVSQRSAANARSNVRPTNVKCGCDNGVVLVGRGEFLNGAWTGGRGKCYRCNGKGWQTPADQKRNAYYDNHVRRVSA